MKKHQAIRISQRDVLFEDKNYLALNKRSGWPVHATVDVNRPNLLDSAKSFLKNRDQEAPYLALHHRLDVRTSGVVLLAKTEAASQVLADLFKNRRITKIYDALCVGQPPEQEGELVDFLKKRVVSRIERMVKVRSGGQKAITRYKLVAQRGELSHMSFELITGRMHQIRAQSALAGFPILGDSLYGDAAENKNRGVSTQLLHASHLKFVDPLSQSEIQISAPLPASFGDLRPAQVPANSSFVRFYKPYGVLSQFTAISTDDRTLADYDLPDGLYPVGRLDKDSEGLLLLTNDGAIKHRYAHPSQGKEKIYWVQVEGIVTDDALAVLEAGVVLRDGKSKPCRVRRISEPTHLAPRDPPIRVRVNIPTCWIEIALTEGKNRQVRRMTAAAGYPTLRLVRVQIAEFTLEGLEPGNWVEI